MGADMPLYRAIDVWEREPGRLARYRCFESLNTGMFCVQSVDFYHDEKSRPELESQFIELLSEQDPFERAGGYSTLQEAIRAHKAEFSPDCDR